MECNGNVNSWKSRRGRFTFRGYLSLEHQRALFGLCRALMDGDCARLRADGARRRHDARPHALPRAALERPAYQYEASRSDFDGLPVPPLPEELRRAGERDRRGRRACASTPTSAS